MQALLRIARGIDALNRTLGRGVAWLTLLMVLVGAYNAIARRLERDAGLQLSSNAFLEAQWYLFSLVFLLGAPYVLRCGGHVRVDVLFGGHSARGRAWIDLCGTMLFLLPFCAFAIAMSWSFVVESWATGETSPDPGGLPRWPLKPVVPLAFFLLALQGVSEAVKRVAILRGAAPADVGLDEPAPAGERA